MFFPGVIGLLESLLFVRGTSEILNREGLLEMMYFIPETAFGWVVVTVLSIFMGLVFQELGRLIRTILKIKNMTKDIFTIETGLFEEKEINCLRALLMEDEWDEKNIFNWINAEAQEKGIASRYVKLSVIHNMSLSLVASMFIGMIEAIVLLLLSYMNGVKDILITAGITIVLCFSLMIIFVDRSERFKRYWVRSLVYAVAVSRAGGEINGDIKSNQDS
jgi:hypothetical protein